MASFPQFPLLPAEIRTYIWQLAIASIPARTINVSARRIVRPDGISCLDLIPPGAPALLHACHDSRVLAAQCRYTSAFASERYVWLDFATDMADIDRHFVSMHPDIKKLTRLKVRSGPVAMCLIDVRGTAANEFQDVSPI